MPNTPDYTDQAASYALKFNAQSRSNDNAAVTANELVDRDNLLFFIEENFKTNVKGGVKLENLRAFLHALVKSVSVLSDDKTFAILMHTSFFMNTGAANRWYFGSQSSGWSSTSWSQYSTQAAINSTTPYSMTGLYSNMGVDVPFEMRNFKVFGSVLNTSATGDVDIVLYYYDNDNPSFGTLQNPVFLCTVPTVTLASAATSYPFVGSASPSVVIPQGKKIFAFIRNTGHGGSGNETLRVTLGFQYSKYSSGFTG
tara:strand:- start:14157 stop:14921 length:765 start_codon:yes stop_codon:yes gene_type:complete